MAGPSRCTTDGSIVDTRARSKLSTRWRNTALRRYLRRGSALDRIAIGLLVAGLLAVATNALPADQALAVVLRILPLLVFLASVIVLAELTAWAGVFDVVATGIARLARGRYPLLFLLCVLFAAVTTSTLNLDTTAVLLTPVMLALAARIGIAAVPLAMTTVWLANTASLLLPVSNLTNLLALDRVEMSPLQFAGRMWGAQLASVAATAACLWLLYWRPAHKARERYPEPVPFRPPDRPLFLLTALACVAFVVALLLDVTLWAASLAAAGVAVVMFAVRWSKWSAQRAGNADSAADEPHQRGYFRTIGAILPWRLLVFVTGLFLVVETISRHGLSDIMSALVGGGNGVADMYRAAAAGAGLSNAVNNLPAYVAGEAVIPVGNHDQLLGLLIGTNVGPVITPWASLATLLWHERCLAFGVAVGFRRFMLTGLVLAVTALGCAVTVLALTR
jgi:arsenical pump membrane protein